MTEEEKLKKITEYSFKTGQDFFCEFIESLRLFDKEEIEFQIKQELIVGDEKFILTKDEIKKLILMRIDHLKELVTKEFENNENWK